MILFWHWFSAKSGVWKPRADFRTLFSGLLCKMRISLIVKHLQFYNLRHRDKKRRKTAVFGCNIDYFGFSLWLVCTSIGSFQDVERHKTVHRKRFPDRKEMISRVFLTCKKVSSLCCNGTFTTLNIILSEAVVTCLVRGIAWRFVPRTHLPQGGNGYTKRSGRNLSRKGNSL